MVCPNCRCQIDVTTRVCPYCGLVIQGNVQQRAQDYNRISGQMRYTSYPDGSQRQQTWTETVPTQKTKPTRPQRKDRQSEDILFYQKLTVVLLAGILMLNLLQLIAMFLI